MYLVESRVQQLFDIYLRGSMFVPDPVTDGEREE